MPCPFALRRARLLAIATCIMLAWAVLLPGMAGAHARVRSSTPADGATLAVAPTQVVLEFSGTVSVQRGSVEVFAPDGSRVDVGAPISTQAGARVTQAIDASDAGTFGVAYRVSSEDGHVITGSLSFSVGAAGGSDDTAVAATRDATRVDRTVQAAFSSARFVEILALLVAAGGGLFACCIAPGWRPRAVVAALVVLLLAYGAGYVLNAAIAHGGGISGAWDPRVIGSSNDTPFALSVRIRSLVALVALGPALLLRFDTGRLAAAARWSMAVVFVGLAASMSITGHAVTTAPTALRMPLDMLHVTAAAIWMGGLVQLARLAPTASRHAVWVTRFSRTAFAAVLVILVTGTYATFAELGLHPGELVDSRYGRLILAKLLLYAATMPLAWNNMTTFVPAIRTRPDDAPGLLRQYVRRELFLLMVVIGLTVWLIATPQP
jgi:copper transport protein